VFPKIFLLHKVVRDAKKVEKHWSSQPILFLRFWEVLKNNIWVKEAQLGKQTNTEHGEENV